MKANKSILTVILLIFTASVYSQEQSAAAFKSDINKSDIKTVLKAVADWQIRTPLTHDPADWTNAALYAGLVEWASISGDNLYYEWLKNISEKNKWSYMVRNEPLGR
jgi:unsaturated rhamnogalacturonyl hydrolase